MGDRATAFHEAGHAVADHRLGFTSFGCSIKSNDDTAGRSHSYDDDFKFAKRGADGVYEIPEEATRNLITALYAGYCAETDAGCEEEHARAGAASDFERARQLREKLPGRTPEAECLANAFMFVRTPENWKAIELVAAELRERDQLDGDEVAIIIEIADGESTPDDLANFRRMRDG